MQSNNLSAILAAILICTTGTACAQAPACPPAADLKLTVGKYYLNLNDKRPICVTVPGNFKITIKIQQNSGIVINAGDVTAKGKPKDDDTTQNDVTIKGDNALDKEKLAIDVGGSAQIDEKFEFWIKVKGVGKLDPIVRVVDNNMMMSLKFAEAAHALDTLGLKLPEGAELELIKENEK